MKTGMKCLILLCIGAALCYGIYSFDQVNRENDRLKVTTFSDRKPQTINGTEYTVLKNTICDYSKIKEQYPVIEPMLDVDGDVAKGEPGRLKVLLVKMRIKNSSEHMQYLNLASLLNPRRMAMPCPQRCFVRSITLSPVCSPLHRA